VGDGTADGPVPSGDEASRRRGPPGKLISKRTVLQTHAYRHRRLYQSHPLPLMPSPARMYSLHDQELAFWQGSLGQELPEIYSAGPRKHQGSVTRELQPSHLR
jgi:hypothetical protein